MGDRYKEFMGWTREEFVARIAELEAALAKATDMAAIAIIEGMEREREACAKIADDCRRSSSMGDFGGGQEAAADAIAALIRARGSK